MGRGWGWRGRLVELLLEPSDFQARRSSLFRGALKLELCACWLWRGASQCQAVCCSMESLSVFA